MDDRFVTLQTFDSPLEANLVKNCLEEAGLRAFLSGEGVVSMAWVLSNAVGGIRLQVAADDVARARAILTSPEELEPARADDDGGRFEIQADERPDQEWGEPEDAKPEATDRERNAERAFRGAVLGILFLPLQLYVSWLLLRVYFSDEPLRGRHRSRAWMAAAINGPFLLGLCILLRVMLDS